ncbi:hypothetical protein STEG23_036668 [Scotinomys teguina]
MGRGELVPARKHSRFSSKKNETSLLHLLGDFLLPSTAKCGFSKKLQIGQAPFDRGYKADQRQYQLPTLGLSIGRSDSIYFKDRVGDELSLVLTEMPSSWIGSPIEDKHLVCERLFSYKIQITCYHLYREPINGEK